MRVEELIRLGFRVYKTPIHITTSKKEYFRDIHGLDVHQYNGLTLVKTIYESEDRVSYSKQESVRKI